MWLWARLAGLPRTVSGLLICVVYHPPSSPHDALLIDHLSTSLESKYSSSGVVILGDFNQLNIDQLCRLTGLGQTVNTPTRGQAILDKILTNMQHHYRIPQITSPIGLSDHN